MYKAITLNDLPNLSDWRFVPIWTIEQAVLIWAGIDPAYCCSFHDARKYSEEQYSRACICKQAFLSGIVLKTLPVHELYLDDDFNNRPYLADQRTDNFTFEDISITRTTVMQMALLNWVKKQNLPTLKQSLVEQDRKEKIKKSNEDFLRVLNEQEAKPILQVEYKPLQPVHETPEFEAACMMVEEFWNKQEKGVKPPKQQIVQDLISKTMEDLTGVKPKQAEIDRIDRLTRPPCFKNQQ